MNIAYPSPWDTGRSPTHARPSVVGQCLRTHVLLYFLVVDHLTAIFLLSDFAMARCTEGFHLQVTHNAKDQGRWIFRNCLPSQ